MDYVLHIFKRLVHTYYHGDALHGTLSPGNLIISPFGVLFLRFVSFVKMGQLVLLNLFLTVQYFS